jgi:hypothetical protein
MRFCIAERRDDKRNNRKKLAINMALAVEIGIFLD